MEHSRYSAKGEIQTSPQYSFYSHALLLGFILASIVAIIFIFPGNALVNTLLNQESGEVDFRYSLVILQKTTNTALNYEKILKNPIQAIQELEANRIAMDKNLWFYYIILRGVVFFPKLSAEAKLVAQQEVIKYLDTFSKQTLTEAQNTQLAKDAVAINKSTMALIFYERVLAQNPNQPIYFYTNIAKTALWAKQCEKSANYFFIGQDKVDNLKDKRFFYFSALNALTSCDKPKGAIELAIKHLDGLSEDIETYQRLINFAIASDKPEKARDFMFKMMELKAKQP